MQHHPRRDGAVVVDPHGVRHVILDLDVGEWLRESVGGRRKRMRLRKEKGQMVSFIKVVIDLEGWNGRVSEIRVGRNGVVVEQVVVGRKGKHCLNLQSHRIHEN